MASSLTEIAYRTIQQGRSLAGLAHKELSTKAMELLAPDVVPSTEPVPDALMNELRRSLSALQDIDWQESEQGLYPSSLLFDIPWLEWAERYPRVWLDLPSNWARRRSRNVQDIPDTHDKELYPDYYLQNFHHQTDGYLSDHSAELYDLQVDILFNGSADSMRRRLIAPLKRGLKRFSDRPDASLRILDVATEPVGRFTRFERLYQKPHSLAWTCLSPICVRPIVGSTREATALCSCFKAMLNPCPLVTKACRR